MDRKIKKLVKGQKTIDGAGVHLVRVLGKADVKDFDPFLMLDSFDSANPEDYIKGFPFHPHRGIETITYLIDGEIEHQDSLGNKGVINPGESQWMTAGSGIIHQEMPQAAARMLGLQIWLNLPACDKMTAPAYFDIKQDMIGRKEVPGGTVRVVAGEYEGVKGVVPPRHPAALYDISLEPGKSLTIAPRPGDNAFVFLIEGDGIVDGCGVEEKTAVLFEMEGDALTVAATENAPLRFFYFAGPPLREPVAWGGPIVMNTEQELRTAFQDLRDNTFIKS